MLLGKLLHVWSGKTRVKFWLIHGICCSTHVLSCMLCWEVAGDTKTHSNLNPTKFLVTKKTKTLIDLNSSADRGKFGGNFECLHNVGL